MLKIENIDVFYDEIKVIHNLSFKVKEGQIVSLLGSNGAGKSTTLKTISGLLQPRNGNVIWKDKSIKRTKASSIISLGISHVPEGRRLFPQMTVEENIMMGAFEKNLWKDRKSNIENVYKMFPRLRERKNQHAGTLSGGERQMVAIGRALMGKPKLLMLDEPSLGLAPNLVEQIFTLIKRLNEQGITILLVEQNVNVALEVSDYAYVIETGELVLDGTATDMKGNDHIKRAYLGL